MAKEIEFALERPGKLGDSPGDNPIWSVTNGCFFSAGAEYGLWLRLFLFFLLLPKENTIFEVNGEDNV